MSEANDKGFTAPVHPFVIRPYYERDEITIYNADCRKVLPWLGKFDLLLTDPPYGIGDEAWKRTEFGPNGRSRHWGDIAEWDVAESWMFETRRCATDAVIWGANMYATPPARSWLLWDKIQDSTRAEVEMAWSTLSSGTKCFRMSRIDAYVNCAEAGKMHPNQKPLQLFSWCLGLFPDTVSVVDPFMGSGTTLVAAKLAGIRAVGIEISEKYCEAAVKRLAQGVLPFDESV